MTRKMRLREGRVRKLKEERRKERKDEIGRLRDKKFNKKNFPVEHRQRIRQKKKHQEKYN